MENRNEERNNELEIDFSRIFNARVLNAIIKNLILIIAVSVIVGALAFVGTTKLIEPKYSSTAKVYLISNSDSKVTQQDMQIGNYLVKDYKELVYTREILEDVIKELNLSESYSELRKNIHVKIPIDTRIVNITAINHDPEVAKNIANTVKDKSIERMKEMSKIDGISTFEKAEANYNPTSPNIVKNTVLATVLAFILTLVIVVLVEILDDKLRFAEDVEEQLNLTLLGIVPTNE